ncbi:MAG: hypothetical protein SW019_16420 [Actinomycetota bacterium]|nr:hypothetical protein [Actinomycetota bacterium]
MAKNLDVDTGGLQVAAASSAQCAAEVLAGGSVGPVVGGRFSEAGVAALDAAAAALRVRQADRIAGQAGDMAAASVGYDDTDGSSADDISVIM